MVSCNIVVNLLSWWSIQANCQSPQHCLWGKSPSTLRLCTRKKKDDFVLWHITKCILNRPQSSTLIIVGTYLLPLDWLDIGSDIGWMNWKIYKMFCALMRGFRFLCQYNTFWIENQIREWGRECCADIIVSLFFLLADGFAIGPHHWFNLLIRYRLTRPAATASIKAERLRERKKEK